MDKVLYVAMSGAKQTMQSQASSANNLANVKTTGFRADLDQLRAMPAFGEGHPTRVFALSERPGYRFDPGTNISTGNDFDFAINGHGWIAVQGDDGNEAYTRRGDLKINANGLLENGAGHLILGNDGPIALPPFDKIDIANDGSISIVPEGAAPNEVAVIDRIKLVLPDNGDLMKNREGLFVRKDGALEVANGAVTVVSGSLEASNVNAIEELTDMISLSRQFELQVKLMQTAEENDKSLERLLQLS
ncbi:flagellar basal-body rod protein FlgF [Pleionea sp. CnH1-48]|uniref:flagellar basal-body rod protein FlgF n=1 Tax=Pleionea sp. CnH1-48 TaxID=2954494 RepID=UPI002096B739|nr:flagellar basal-body rod protein FlgF [Pleionea sp. CnH1-48]MCO7226157.1 flagellar basal-body rod protein FlgF [Pleionea sp. CnH1-48]